MIEKGKNVNIQDAEIGMNALIELMIEMYIFTRMSEVLMSKNKGYTIPVNAKILAEITLDQRGRNNPPAENADRLYNNIQ